MTNYKKCPLCGAIRGLFQVINGKRVYTCFKCFKKKERFAVPATLAKSAALSLALIGSLLAGPVWADGFGEIMKTHALVSDDHGTIVTCNDALTACWTPCEIRLWKALGIMLSTDRPFITYKGSMRANQYGGLYKSKGQPWMMLFSREYEKQEEAARDLEYIRLVAKECAQ